MKPDQHKIIRLPAVKNLIGLSGSAIYERMSKGTFPEQINLGGRAVGWTLSSVHDWIDERIAVSKQTTAQ